MAINRSQIESVELSTGSEAYVQSSGIHSDSVTLSFDYAEGSFTIRITKEEARQYAKILTAVANGEEV